MFISTLVSPSIIIYAQYQVVYTVPESTQVICVPHECSWAWAGDLIYVIFVSFYGLTLANYIIIWIVLKWHSWKSTNQNLGKNCSMFLSVYGAQSPQFLKRIVNIF
ncbi:unnamed protein product [Meloidogyne enterolobii]|uniref:Uncharacterized protein n=1 Tax=Meloidogyne enterolobii TaxID=390850 RepID=A0ACB1APX0_MELEN